MPMMPTKVSFDRMEGDVAVLTCGGWLETQASEDLKKVFSTLLQEKGVKKIVMDLGDVDYVNSAALGTLLHYGTLLREGGGNLVFCSLKRNLHRLFDLVGLGKVFARVNTVEEALTTFGAAGKTPPTPRIDLRPET